MPMNHEPSSDSESPDGPVRFKDSMQGDAAFPETRDVLPLPPVDDIDARRQRLGQIMERYRIPLRAYLMYRRRCSRGQAADLVQGFFADRIWEKQILDQYDAQRGSRLRSFLLSSLMNYVIDHERRERKRRGQVAIDECPPPAVESPPVLDAERAWGRSVLTNALAGMKAECEEKQRLQTWELFDVRVIRPALESTEAPSYDELLTRFNFSSPSQAYNELATAKRMFERHLNAAMKKEDGTPADDETLSEQIENLLALFRGPAPDRGE